MSFSQDPQSRYNSFLTEYETLKAKSLALDLTRGKPSSAQLDLSNAMDSILADQFQLDGTDLRNYGGLDGLPSLKQLFANMIDVDSDAVIIGGNASLTLMHQCTTLLHFLGLAANKAWFGNVETPTFICPCPGYDRHFSICEHLGIAMITVAMTETGPDMDAVEQLIATNPNICGMWCVPRFSNPTGIVYSDETVDRIAQLGLKAQPHFKVFYDNAYCVHHLSRSAKTLTPIAPLLKQYGTEDSLIHFGSTSKITFAGAGVAFMASSPANVAALKKHFANITIGPDKVNQAKHVLFLKDNAHLLNHMDKHAAILQPKFDCVLEKLSTAFGDNDAAHWTIPEGGYFVSLDVKPGLAKRVIDLAAGVGVKLTPAGATFPYGNDPLDCNIRIAPSVPPLEEVAKAMDVIVACVQLATAEQTLNLTKTA